MTSNSMIRWYCNILEVKILSLHYPELDPNKFSGEDLYGIGENSNASEYDIQPVFGNSSSSFTLASCDALNDGSNFSQLHLQPTTSKTVRSSNSTPSPTSSNTRLTLERTSSVVSNISDIGDGAHSTAICVVCGDEGAKTHYGVLACLGCKGFFRRALKKADQYECLNQNQCVINKYERNSCRSCRLKKCLDAGMDPSAVRPDRDFTGKQHGIRLPPLRKSKKEASVEKDDKNKKSSDSGDDWIKKLPVEMRTTLMTLLNIETKVARGDTLKDASEVYPLGVKTLKEILEDPCKLKGRRTEMRYEPYRMAKNEELSMIVYRRLIAAIDWIEYLSEIMDGLETNDKIALIKSCFAPLTIFKFSSRTAVVTSNENVLCLCNFAYVPRNIAKAYSDAYHLDNGLVEQCLTELVFPFRKIQIKEEEIVLLSAIIILNPLAKDLSEEGIQKVSRLRDRIMDTFFTIIKETRQNTITTSYFGNFLLYLPIVTHLANAMSENLRFAQTFSSLGSFPVLTSLFGCFPIEPFMEADPEKDHKKEVIRKNAEVQTDPVVSRKGRGQKRRMPATFTNPVENDNTIEQREFRLLRPPCNYTLTEMFEDRMYYGSATPRGSLTPQNSLPRLSPRRRALTASASWTSGPTEPYRQVQTPQQGLQHVQTSQQSLPPTQSQYYPPNYPYQTQNFSQSEDQTYPTPMDTTPLQQGQVPTRQTPHQTFITVTTAQYMVYPQAMTHNSYYQQSFPSNTNFSHSFSSFSSSPMSNPVPTSSNVSNFSSSMNMNLPVTSQSNMPIQPPLIENLTFQHNCE